MQIIGHKKIMDMLNRQIVRRAISHAYLFSGPESVGKFTLAMEFAKKMGAGQSGIDPDLIIIQPEEVGEGLSSGNTEIKIGKIRELQRKLGLSPQAGKFKIAIIDGADRLNHFAQNALLKSLEEAREQNVIILIVQNEDKMLPTIVSRCQKVRFTAVSNSEITKLTSASAEEIFWSLGRPGILSVIHLDRSSLLERKLSGERLKEIMRMNMQQKLVMAEEMSTDIQSTLQTFGLWMVMLRETVLGRSVLPIKTDKALNLIEEIQKAISNLRETRANARLIMENLFIKL